MFKLPKIVTEKNVIQIIGQQTVSLRREMEEFGHRADEIKKELMEVQENMKQLETRFEDLDSKLNEIRKNISFEE